MKRTIQHCVLLLLMMSLIVSCEEQAVEAPVYPALSPSVLDQTGGNWKPVLVSKEDIPLSTPATVESTTYQQELANLLEITGNVTASQKETISYWSSGTVLRWNEIARQLVIKYNVAPVVGAPFDPLTPFTNPPFASRAYALLSVAQYDALVAAWHYKYKFNRSAPYHHNSDIKPLLPKSDLPSYPSEDAVIAAASQAVLTFLFPKEAEFLQKKAEENLMSRLWAGVNVASDLDAGEAIGKLVAEKTIAYAKEDRMSEARDVQNTWKHIQVDNPWLCLEKPERPPMLPLYGRVKTWYDSLQVFSYMPPPPPAIDSKEFQDDIKQVRAYSDNRTREYWKIADYWADGAGTPTPPGHWNVIAADLIRKHQFNELRTARTLALMNRAVMDGGILCWHAKYYYYLPRPSQLDPNITVATGIPNFPSYTSGHSTFSAAAATVLSYVFPEEKKMLTAMAEEAGLSRVVGGIHYNCDNIAGRNSGIGVGEIAVAWGQSDGSGL